MASSGWKDFVYIALAVGAFYAVLSLYAGVLMPVVTVETNSMMHPDVDEYTSGTGSAIGDDVGFGRLGTLDPGDLTLLKAVDRPEEIDTFADGGEERFGKPGDVIAYEKGSLTVIHRAMTYVTVQGEGEDREYHVRWAETWTSEFAESCRQQPQLICTFNATGVTIPELGLTGTVFTRDGFITMGDNPVSILQNGRILETAADQADPSLEEANAIHEDTVTMDEIVGEARGELPALGLLKLGFSGSTIINAEMEEHRYFFKIGNMVAPFDLWAVLVVELIVIAVAPVFFKMGRDWWEGRQQEVVPELSVLERAWRDARHERARRTRSPSSEDTAETSRGT